MTHTLRALALGASLLLALSGAQAANLQYTFDADAQGFTAIGAELTPTGGYLALKDLDNLDFVVVLPSGALGDWSAFSGGAFSFDAINLNGASTDWLTFGTLRIESGALAVERDVVPQPAPAAQWTTYSTTLDAATWGSVLGNVTRVTLMLESHAGWDANTGYEFNGLDNVRVTAVPEPATWALSLLGVVAVAAWGRRRA
ncbi:MAG: hypothetical protein RI907_3119 [Pseudomonadota bacterium]|jgi:hypothetical protein